MERRFRTDAGTLEWDPVASTWVQKQPQPGEDVSALTYIPPDALADIGADASLQGNSEMQEADARASYEYDATPSPMARPGMAAQRPQAPAPRGRPVQMGEAAKGAAPRMHESLAALAPNGPRADVASSRTAVAGAEVVAPEKPSDLRMAEEILAMKQGGDRKMWAQLQRAAATASNAMGGGLDMAAYDAMDADAGQPLADLQARRGMEAQASQRDLAKRHADPASPESRAAQEILRGIIGDTPALARMPYAQIVRDFPMISKQADMEAKRLEHETARADRNAAREDQQRATWENSEANRANSRFTAGLMAQGMHEGRAMAQQERLRRDMDERAVGGLEFQEGRLPAKADAQALKSTVEAVRAIDNSLRRMEDVFGQKGAEFGFGSDRAASVQAREDAILAMKEVANLGVLNGRDYEILSRLLPDPNSTRGVLAPGDIKSQFDEFRRQLASKLAASADARGYRITDPSLPGGPARNGPKPPPRPGMVRIRMGGRMGWADPDAVPQGAEVVNDG